MIKNTNRVKFLLSRFFFLLFEQEIMRHDFCGIFRKIQQNITSYEAPSDILAGFEILRAGIYPKPCYFLFVL